MNNINTVAQVQQANISEFLRVLFRRKANEVGGIVKLAEIVGINAHRYYNQMDRGNGILADLIVEHCRKTGDDAPLRAIADACGKEITPKPRFLRKAHPGKPVRSFELDVHHATSALTLLVEDALSDGGLNSIEKEAIKAAAQKARVEIAELVAKIEGEGR